MTGSYQIDTTRKKHTPFLQQTGDYVFCLEDLELAFPSEHLKEIVRLWNEGASIPFIAKRFKRNPHEIFIALYDQGRKGTVTRPFYEKGDVTMTPEKEDNP